jgi:hypothetical protein
VTSPRRSGRAERLEAGPHGRVDHRVADLDHHAAEQFGVHADGHDRLPAEGAPQGGDQRVALGGAERDRGGHRHAHAARPLVEQLPVRGGDARQQPEPVVVDQNADQPAEQVRPAGPQRVGQGGGLRLLGDRRVREERGHRRAGGRAAGEARELRPDLVHPHLRLLARRRQQRFGVDARQPRPAGPGVEYGLVLGFHVRH